MYTGAISFAARVALDARAARRWLPPGSGLAAPTTATVFAAHFAHTSFGSVHDEADIFFHVRRRFRDAALCPWMVVTDDVDVQSAGVALRGAEPGGALAAAARGADP